MRQIAATGCCNKSPRVACENRCRCDRILSLRSVAQIQTGLNLCDISQRQIKRKRLVAAAVQTRRLVASCVSACKYIVYLSILFARFFVRRIISQFQCIVFISVNRSLVNRWLASSFVPSSSFARRDGSLFANLQGIIIQFNACQS